MQVTYKERIMIDMYRCIDREITRYFDKSWQVGGLTYFKQGQFNIFSVDTDFIISITQ